jgi:hypothetical protein
MILDCRCCVATNSEDEQGMAQTRAARQPPGRVKLNLPHRQPHQRLSRWTSRQARLRCTMPCKRGHAKATGSKVNSKPLPSGAACHIGLPAGKRQHDGAATLTKRKPDLLVAEDPARWKITAPRWVKTGPVLQPLTLQKTMHVWMVVLCAGVISD